MTETDVVHRTKIVNGLFYTFVTYVIRISYLHSYLYNTKESILITIHVITRLGSC